MNSGIYSPLELQPQNIEAEQSLISAIMIDNNVLDDVADIIEPEDFYATAHKKIYAGILELTAQGKPADLVTLANLLRNKKQLDSIGGAVYLSKIADSVPPAVHAGHYAGIIRRKSALRSLIRRGNEIINRSLKCGDDVEEVIDFAERSILEISTATAQPSCRRVGELMLETIERLEERQKNRAIVTGVPSGFRDLDCLTAGFQKADLIILAARPSMGKTALALNIARHAAVEIGIPVAVFSLEMSEEQLAERLLTAEAKVNAGRLRGGFISRDDWMELNNAAENLASAPIFIDDSTDLTAWDIRARSRRLKKNEGIGLVVIDYLQLIKSRQSAERRDLEISEISRSLKYMAKELKIPVIALSQLNRMLEKRVDKRPILSDLRESGALEQDADLVIFIYRDEVYNEQNTLASASIAEITLAKQRNGPIGSLKLTFFKPYTRFENMSNECSF
ncbi:MAG: replicative DNA helicase [Desulfobacterales bacterium]|nr:MAG: replicative DNA helicase [Desulfobacterales bacterium]